MSFELDENGLQTQTQAEIFEELESAAKETWGANLKTSATSLMGQLLHFVAEVYATCQEAALALYESIDPSGARERPLDARLALTGSTRLGATASYVDGILTFTGAGTANAGDLISNDDNSTIWELAEAVVSTGAGTYDARFTCTETGPVLAQAGTTWSLITAIPNCASFTNPTDDAEIGRDQEKDGDARARRQMEIYSQGQGPLATIRGAVSKVDGVLSCRVYHNPSTYPADSDLIPFKAFNAVVECTPSTPSATTQQAIFEAIVSAMGAGGEAYGTSYAGTVVDGEGNEHQVAFDVISEVDADVSITLTTSTSENPVTPNITTIVGEHCLEYAQENWEEVGRDVLALDFQGLVGALIEAGTISGVDAATVEVGPHGGPYSSKFEVGIRERADFDSGNFTVIEN